MPGKAAWYTLDELRNLGITLTGDAVEVDIARGVRLDCGRGRGPMIQIADHVSITKGCQLLTHDGAGAKFDGVGTIGRVIIEDHVFIGINSILLPGTCVRRGSILAAGSVLYPGTIVPEGEIWGGAPARKLGTVAVFLEKRKEMESTGRQGRGNIPPGQVRLTGTPNLHEHYKETLKNG